VLKQSREDDVAQILEKVWFERWLSILVISKIIEELVQ
jgi:hypothetical protein